MDPTVEEKKTKALEERKKRWRQEDEEEAQRLEQEGKPDHDSLLFDNRTLDEKQEDVTRIFVKILRTHDFANHFPIAQGQNILQLLRRDFEFYRLKPWNAESASACYGDVTLDLLKGQLAGRRANICLKVTQLSNTNAQIETEEAQMVDVLKHYKVLAKQLWREMLDMTLICLFLHGVELDKEIE